MTQTMSGTLGAGAPRERIGTITLVKGAIARIRAAGLPLLAFWLAYSAIQSVMQIGVTQAGLKLAMPSLSLGYLAYAAVGAAVAGLGTALGLRLLLRGREGWLKADRGLFECAALYGLMASGILILSAAMASGSSTAADPGALAVRSFAFLALYLVGIYVALKLTLWPIGLLTRHAEVTPARSWRLMRKATRGYILAHVVFGIPFMIVLFGGRAALGVQLTEVTPAASVLSAFAGVVFAIFSQAVTATLFHLRVEAPSSVAEVFD